MKFKRNTKQRTKSIQGLRSFKDTLPQKIKKILNRKGEIYSETLENWKYIVGKELFEFCFPKSIKKSNRLGSSCLIIMVKRGHEIDVEYSKKSIIDKMNILFRCNMIEKIKLISFEEESKKNKINKNNVVSKNEHFYKISTIKNNKIKSSLIELSKLYKSR